MTEIKNCAIIRDLLPGYIEQLLSNDGKAAVTAHLADCPQCRQIYSDMKEGTNESTTDQPALDGFKKIRRRTRRLKWIAASTLTLIFGALITEFLLFFVIGKPASTHLLDSISCTYDNASGSLTIEGRAENLNICKVVWETDSEEDFLINVLVYERASLPFVSETHDFALTIPDAEGYDVCIACPNYDRTKIYSWRNDHYKQIDQMEEAIFCEFPSLNPEKDILSCRPGIHTANNMNWLVFSVDHLIGENASWWYWGDKLVTDGELEPAGYDIWVSLEQPYQIQIEYWNETAQKDGPM